MNGQGAFLLLRCWYLLAPVSSWGQCSIALDFTATPRKPTKHNNKKHHRYLTCHFFHLVELPSSAPHHSSQKGSAARQRVSCCEDQGGIRLAPSANSRFGASWHYVIHIVCIIYIICVSARLAASHLSCNFSASFCFPVKTFLS